MNRFLHLLAVGTLGACTAMPPVVPADFNSLAENACLPEAIIMAETLHEQGVAARILIVNTQSWSHAVVVFQFPLEQPQTWVWDVESKAVPVKAPYGDAVAVGNAWLDSTLRSGRVISASFL